ncbi:hypothetical protein L810_3164 [Burkholderia sp. AU4i]|nr:hypothetical protein L810_3164 [Burkholderia sp. AU4i]
MLRIVSRAAAFRYGQACMIYVMRIICNCNDVNAAPGCRLPGWRPSATVAAKIRRSEIQRENRGPHHVIFLSRRVPRDATHRARPRGR